MATPEVDAIKRNTDNAEGYTDEALQALLDAGLSVSEVSSNIWQEKAAKYSNLVNVSESGSSRSMGDLYKNALAMAKHFQVETVEETAATAPKRVRTATRA